MKMLECASLFALSALALSLVACNPNAPNNHPGSPPVVNESRSEPPPAILPENIPGNVAPKSFGTPALLDYARNQAGQVGPRANNPFGEEQLKFGTTAGRNSADPARTHNHPQDQNQSYDNARVLKSE